MVFHGLFCCSSDDLAAFAETKAVWYEVEGKQEPTRYGEREGYKPRSCQGKQVSYFVPCRGDKTGDQVRDSASAVAYTFPHVQDLLLSITDGTVQGSIIHNVLVHPPKNLTSFLVQRIRKATDVSKCVQPWRSSS